MVGLSTAACCENLDGFLDFMQTRFGSAQLLPLPKSRGRRLRSVPVLLSFFSCLLSPEFSFHCSSAHPFSFLAFALHCAHHYCRWLLRKGGETWWVPQIRLPHLRMSLCFLSLSHALFFVLMPPSCHPPACLAGVCCCLGLHRRRALTNSKVTVAPLSLGVLTRGVCLLTSQTTRDKKRSRVPPGRGERWARIPARWMDAWIA